MREHSCESVSKNILRLGGSCRLGIAALVFACLAVLAGASPAMAGTVTGMVHNGTNGKPAAGVDIILIQLQGDMQPIANTKTDAQGLYKIDNPAVGGQQPMLIRAVYKGVMFHQPLLPGGSSVDITVYDSSSDPKTVAVDSWLIVLQPNGATLLVGEQYALQNQSKPPVTYFNQQGDFNFHIPDGAKLEQVSSWGPSRMPLVQGTMDRGAQHYAIAYAFQPGDNGVQLSYQLPYDSNQAKIHLTPDYAVQHVMLLAPPTVKVDSAGFSPAGSEQGYSVYSRDGMAPGAAFDVSVSGTAPPPSDAQQSQTGGGGGDSQAPASAEQSNGHQDSVAIQALPNRLDSLRWMLIAGFAALFALGLVFVWRRPVAMAPAAAGVPAASPVPPGPRTRKSSSSASISTSSSTLSLTPAPAAVVEAPPAIAPVAEPSNGQGTAVSEASNAEPSVEPSAVAQKPVPHAVPNAVPNVEQRVAQTEQKVEHEVSLSLDALKDRLFRLELRRQAGTISEEDYAREHARMEQLLRDLVRG